MPKARRYSKCPDISTIFRHVRARQLAREKEGDGERRRLRNAWSRVRMHEVERQNFPIARMHGLPEVVKNPKSFGNIFRTGERVLEIHLYAVEPREMLRTTRVIVANFEKWKAQGYVGIFGDTPTVPVWKQWEKIGGAILKSPRAAVTNAREHYHRGVKLRNFSKAYSKTPVKRVVFRFPE